ncbi:hypothetical protein BDY24DRAFT_443499 [Mrakia frigida]|uniref:uncharacterized protein n=1 Tax=Mrakia frigida TaxID=29902 RepID=UPI003FCBF2A8
MDQNRKARRRREGRNPDEYIPGLTPCHPASNAIWREYPGIPHRCVASTNDQFGFTSSRQRALPDDSNEEEKKIEHIVQCVARHQILPWYDELLGLKLQIVRLYFGLSPPSDLETNTRYYWNGVYESRFRPWADACVLIIKAQWKAARGQIEVDISEMGAPVFVDIYGGRFRVVNGQRVDAMICEDAALEEKKRKLSQMASVLASKPSKKIKPNVFASRNLSQMLPPSLPPSQHLQPSQSSSHNHDVCDAQDDFPSSSTSSQLKTLDPAMKKPRTKKSKVIHEVEDGTDQENARAREQRKTERAAKRARKAAKMERREMERVKYEWAEALEVEWKAAKRATGAEESDFEEELDSTTPLQDSSTGARLPLPNQSAQILIEPAAIPLPCFNFLTQSRTPHFDTSNEPLNQRRPNPSSQSFTRRSSPLDGNSDDDWIPIPGGIFDTLSRACFECHIGPVATCGEDCSHNSFCESCDRCVRRVDRFGVDLDEISVDTAVPTTQHNNPPSPSSSPSSSLPLSQVARLLAEEYCPDCDLYSSEGIGECSCIWMELCPTCQMCEGCGKDAPSFALEEERIVDQRRLPLEVELPSSSRMTSLELLRSMPSLKW